MSWIISSEQSYIPKNYERISNQSGIQFGISDKGKMLDIGNGIIIFMDGYILPRLEYINDFKDYNNPLDLIKNLYNQYFNDFVYYIKGSFTIIIIKENRIDLFNDYHAFNKFYYYDNKEKLILASEQHLIVNSINLQIRPELIALYSIMEHFVEGYTLYNGLKYSMPASHLSINDNFLISSKSYFNIGSIIQQRKEDISRETLTDYWKKNIESYIQFIKPKGVSLTLTGGNDSRLILATLLKIGLKPKIWSFGNPNSFDGVVSQKIANKLSLKYTNHFNKNIDLNWFSNLSNQIINKGNGMINIHRAHRLDAVQREVEEDPISDMLFAGFMGGDYLKGLSYDDYITPRILRLYKETNTDLPDLVKEELYSRHIRLSESDFENLIEIVENLSFIKESDIEMREWLILYNLIGNIHDMQDTNVFNSHYSYIVNPYMDIDFLIFLYKSKYTWTASSNFLHKVLRIDRSKFQLESTHQFTPELSDIEYAKTGYYNANEYLRNPIIILLAKRYLRLKKNKKYPKSFGMGNWLKEFVEDQFEKLDDNIINVFNIEELKKELNNESMRFDTEGYWHLYTNPINLSLIIKNNHK